MGKMQYQQADTTGLCADAALNEEWQNYLIDYLLDGGAFLENYPEICLEPVGNNQAVGYVYQPEAFTGEREDVDYNKVPRLYGLMDTRELEETGVLRVRRSPQLGLRGQGVLIGVIDTGIDLTDRMFRYEDGGTKVAALWDQSGQSKPETGMIQDGQRSREARAENELPGAPFGRVWNRQEIDEMLAENPRLLPEDEEGHGTFLAAVAAGREDAETGFSGAAPDSELVIVKLKRPKKYLLDFYSVGENVWACQEDDVLLAIRYVLDVSSALQRPVSICLGIGTNLGGHSGNGSLERYISQNSLLPGISFHIAAGNEGISGHHFRGNVPADGGAETVEFNVSEGESGFIMELWGEAPVTFSVGLISPGGENVERIQLKFNEFRSIRFFPEGTILQIRSFTGETAGGEQVIRMNFRNPAAGLWRLLVYAQGTGNRTFNLWMPITNFLNEDTFFVSPEAADTLTSPGDAFYGITYVPYDVAGDSLYVRASQGYTRDGRVKPDLAAPGVNVRIPAPTEFRSAVPGNPSVSDDASGAADPIDPINPAISDGGTEVSLPVSERRREISRSGSSVAAAFGAGLGALMQEWAIVKQNDLSLNGQNMRFYLIQGASRPDAYEYPNREWGYGMVNIYDAFLSMRG